MLRLLSFAICFALLLSVQAATTPQQVEMFIDKYIKSVRSDVDIICVLEHCLTPSLGCVADEQCRNALECAQKCLSAWDNDTTKEKFHVQNCTNKCTVTYDDEAYDNLMACYTGHNCVSFPPIPNTCRAPDVHPLKNISLEVMKGGWWGVRGYNPVYDCYPCQHPSFKPINASSWNYLPQYQVYLTNGSLKLASQNFIMPNSTPGSNITFTYHVAGLENSETWWLLDMADDESYVLMYYCGNTLQWHYEGAVVFSRNRTLADSAYAKIAVSYQKSVGLDLKEFCNPRTSTDCPD